MLMTAMLRVDVPLYPGTDFCGKSQQCLTLDYIPETSWNPIRFLTEIKVKFPIKSNSEFGEDSGGEMKMGKAQLTGPHEGESMETVQILTRRQVTSKSPYFLHHGSQTAFLHWLQEQRKR